MTNKNEDFEMKCYCCGKNESLLAFGLCISCYEDIKEKQPELTKEELRQRWQEADRKGE